MLPIFPSVDFIVFKTIIIIGLHKQTFKNYEKNQAKANERTDGRVEGKNLCIKPL